MSEKQTADLDMIASGALSPLTGFMVQADYDRVVSDMHLENGLPWALPVTLSVPERPTAGRLALEGHGGELLAVIDVADVFEADRRERPRRSSAPPTTPIRAWPRCTPRAASSSAAR